MGRHLIPALQSPIWESNLDGKRYTSGSVTMPRKMQTFVSVRGTGLSVMIYLLDESGRIGRRIDHFQTNDPLTAYRLFTLASSVSVVHMQTLTQCLNVLHHLAIHDMQVKTHKIVRDIGLTRCQDIMRFIPIDFDDKLAEMERKGAVLNREPYIRAKDSGLLLYGSGRMVSAV